MSAELIPTLSDRLTAVFAIDPAAPAVQRDERWFSWGELSAIGGALDSALASAGLGEGAPIGVMLRNRPAHLAVTLALLRTRRCVVTINPSLPDEPLAEDIAAIEMACLVADADDWARPGVFDAASAQNVLQISIASEPTGLRLTVAARDGVRVMAPRPGVAVQMLTSGTTGKPKRIDIRYESLERSLHAGSKYEKGAQGELTLKRGVGIQWMPLVHIGGFFGALYAIYNARSFVLMERFDVDTWHRLIVQHRPKFVNLPPSALYMVLERNYPAEDFASLLALRSGAAPLDHNLALEFERRYNVPVLEGYGATEFAGGVAGWTIGDHRKFAATKRASVGRANAGVQLRIVDRESGDALPAETPGLLEVRSEQIDGGKEWIRTSDMARLDADGFLYILGRADSAIIRGGFKIMPDKVEEALLAAPGVREACVVGLPDERLGQVPKAAVAGDGIDGESLKTYLKGRLKPYEVPVEILVLETMPRTPSLKISQQAVRQLFAAPEPAAAQGDR